MQIIAPVFPWKKATFLHVRATAKGDDPAPGDDPVLQEAERRASAWRQLMSGDDATLDERLSSVGLDREAFLRILVLAVLARLLATRTVWAEASLMPALRRLVPSEHADLRLGDVPLFTARPAVRPSPPP